MKHLLKSLEQERNRLINESEELWRQRSRAIWIRSGDQNTKFFHNFTNFRRNNKYIWEIMDDEGHIHTGQKNIKAEAIKHLNIFSRSNDDPSTPEQVRVAEKFSRMITEAEAEVLYAPIQLEELRDILKKFKIDKSPGPDGCVVSPRPSPVVNQVLKGIVIMFYRLVSQVLISWRLMCLLGQGA
jgi:hypothetical protein